MCDQCGTLRIDAGGGRCARCTSKHGRKLHLCVACSTGTVRRSGGVCFRCRRRSAPPRKRKLVVCSMCSMLRLVGAHGLCNRCYLRGRVTSRTCTRCSNRVIRLTRTMCWRCFINTDEPWKRAQKRLIEAGLSWASRTSAQFVSYLRRRSYSRASAWGYLSKLTATLLTEPAASEREWLKATAQRLAHHLANHGRLLGLDARLREFIVDVHKSTELQLRTDPMRGMTERVLTGAPEAFVADLRFYHRLMLEEAQYRKANREFVRSPRTHYGIVRRLARWAHWMTTNGLSAWQQLTPEHFRRHLIELGVIAKPTVVADALYELRRFFIELVSHRRMFQNPLTRAAVAPPQALESRAVPIEALQGWLAVLNNEQTSAIQRLVGLLVAFHGLTPKELRGLWVRDADLRRRALRLRSRRLTIDLDPLTFDALKAYVAARPAAANRHLFVTSKTRLSLTAASSGFIMQHLCALGIRSRSTRQHLIRAFASQQGTLVAAQYFRVSTNQISKHMLHQEILFSKSKQ